MKTGKSTFLRKFKKLAFLLILMISLSAMDCSAVWRGVWETASGPLRGVILGLVGEFLGEDMRGKVGDIFDLIDRDRPPSSVNLAPGMLEQWEDIGRRLGGNFVPTPRDIGHVSDGAENVNVGVVAPVDVQPENNWWDSQLGVPPTLSTITQTGSDQNVHINHVVNSDLESFNEIQIANRATGRAAGAGGQRVGGTTTRQPPRTSRTDQSANPIAGTENQPSRAGGAGGSLDYRHDRQPQPTGRIDVSDNPRANQGGVAESPRQPQPAPPAPTAGNIARAATPPARVQELASIISENTPERQPPQNVFNPRPAPTRPVAPPSPPQSPRQVTEIVEQAQSRPSFTYSISTGRFSSSEGWFVYGYAGGGSVAQGDTFDSTHQNNPDSTSIRNFGPLPAGIYTITGYHHTITRNTIILEPNFSTNRTLLRIHGDSISNPRRASRGCVIIGPTYRQKIVDAFHRYGDLTLTVTR